MRAAFVDLGGRNKVTPIHQWTVDIKEYEITVVKISNDLGIRSYGWIDKDKILIAECDSCDANWLPQVKEKLLKVAYEVCEELNNNEYSP